MTGEIKIGYVSVYFSKISVAAIKLSKNLKIGSKVHIKGHTTDFEQVIDSIQIHNKQVEKAKPGDEIGIKVIDRVRKNDRVYLSE